MYLARTRGGRAVAVKVARAELAAVLDFGITRAVESTRLTATGTAFGTPGFLSPEQALGHEVTGAADMFALGAVLVAAAGGSAWGEGTPMGLMYRSVHEPPNLAAVPAPLAGLVARCLAKDPAARPTATELLDLLTEQTPRPAPARTPYPRPRPHPRRRRPSWPRFRPTRPRPRSRPSRGSVRRSRTSCRRSNSPTGSPVSS
ncbi:protein kinase [Streptomyces sp. NPDC052107]|uniref:protein kinase domain-containing protein n=1 Tax=Streptomyces sp. NPDC052107 TaxID=3155632 RepID=UPI003440AD6A